MVKVYVNAVSSWSTLMGETSINKSSNTKGKNNILKSMRYGIALFKSHEDWMYYMILESFIEISKLNSVYVERKYFPNSERINQTRRYECF